ncbi:hypothetical protein ACFLYM_02325 [Chloroflexota bacterium]
MVEDENSRDLEHVYRSAVSGLYGRLKSNNDFIYQRFGDDGIKLIAEMSRAYGLSIAGRAKKRLKDNDLLSVADYLLRIFDTIGRHSDYAPIVERSESRIVIKFNKCPLHFDKPEMCLAHTEMEKTVVEELNPDLLYRIGKSIPAGDDCCEHILEYKAQLDNSSDS